MTQSIYPSHESAQISMLGRQLLNHYCKRAKRKTGKYMIVRFRYPNIFQPEFVVKRGVTLAQAQAHCKDPATSVKNNWFDGYEEE